MSKGDGRRTENTAQVEANWPWPDPPRRHGRDTPKNFTGEIGRFGPPPLRFHGPKCTNAPCTCTFGVTLTED